MMRNFLANNRDDLIARCKAKVVHRLHREATEQQLANGIPLFLDQLTRALQAEAAGHAADGSRISGTAAGDALSLSEIGVAATPHGHELLKLGYSVDQVVHDYGDLCRAITELAFERDAPFAIEEFRTLDRCLDNAIADAVTEFSFQRDSINSRWQTAEANQRVGFLVHELRNALGSATLALGALELGNLTVSGSTGAVLKRSLASLGNLISTSLDEVRSGAPVQPEPFSMGAFVADAKSAA